MRGGGSSALLPSGALKPIPVEVLASSTGREGGCSNFSDGPMATADPVMNTAERELSRDGEKLR